MVSQVQVFEGLQCQAGDEFVAFKSANQVSGFSKVLGFGLSEVQVSGFVGVRDVSFNCTFRKITAKKRTKRDRFHME